MLVNVSANGCRYSSAYDLQDNDDIQEMENDFLEMRSGDLCEPDAASELYHRYNECMGKVIVIL